MLDFRRHGRPAQVLAGLVFLALLAAGCGGGGASSGGDSAMSSGDAVARAKEFGSEAGRSETEQAEAAVLGYAVGPRRPCRGRGLVVARRR